MHISMKKVFTSWLQFLVSKKTACSKLAVSNEHGTSHAKLTQIQKKGGLWEEDAMKVGEIPPSTQHSPCITHVCLGVPNKSRSLYTRLTGVQKSSFLWNMFGLNVLAARQHHTSAGRSLASSHFSTQPASLDISRRRSYGPNYAVLKLPCAVGDLFKIPPKFNSETGFANSILNEVQNMGFWVSSDPRHLSMREDQFQDLPPDPAPADQRDLPCRPDSPVSSQLTMRSNASKAAPLWFRNESGLPHSKLHQGQKMDLCVEEVENRNILVLQWLFRNHQSDDEDQEVTKSGPLETESYLNRSAGSSGWSSPASSLSDDPGYSEILFCLENHLLESGVTEVWVMTVCVEEDNKDRPASPFSSCWSQNSDWSTDELPVFTYEPGD